MSSTDKYPYFNGNIIITKNPEKFKNLFHKKKFYVDLITIDACDSKDVNKAINVIAKKYKKIDIL